MAANGSTLLCWVLVITLLCTISTAAVRKPCKPNIILILVDDQDPDLNSTHPRYMPSLNKWFVKGTHNGAEVGGVQVTNHRINTPICCPSRATLLSGRHVHNTNFTDLWPPHGGYTYWKLSKQEAMGYMPTWLQGLGYYTSYIGKLFMEFGIYNFNLRPRGFNHTDLLCYPWVFDYDHPVFSINSQPPMHYPGNYSTDVIAEKAVAEIKNAAKLARDQGIPFHISIAPTACHDWMNWKDSNFLSSGKLLGPPLAPKRYQNSFSDVTLPRKPNFMEGDATFQYKAKWLRNLHPNVLEDTAFLDEYYRQRLRALAAADDMIEAIMQALVDEGILEDTYVFYTSDNGYHVGAHRMHGGKESPFEEDTRVPFFVRGPGLRPGMTDTYTVSSHVDLPATFVTLGGGDFRRILTDGQPMPMHRWADPKQASYFSAFQVYKQYESTPIEYWGTMSDQLSDVLQVPMEIQELPNSYLLYPSISDLLYKAIKADFADYSAGQSDRLFKYIVSCGSTEDRELYDLSHDPYELYNLVNVTSPYHSAKYIRKILNRMDALVSAGYACINYTNCIAPFANLNASMAGWPRNSHNMPAPRITSLAQSLDDRYDSFFERYGEKTRFRWVTKNLPGKLKTDTGCLDYFDWDNEKGAFDAYPWIKPAKNPHYVVDWGTFSQSVIASTDPVTLAQQAAAAPELQEELGINQPNREEALAAAIATAQTSPSANMAVALIPKKAWPGVAGVTCSMSAGALRGGRRRMMRSVQQMKFEEAPVEKFGRQLSRQEIDETVAWIQNRIKTHPHELNYFQ